MSSFRLILSLVVVVLLAAFIGAPFYFAPDTVQGTLSDSSLPPQAAPPSTAPTVSSKVPTAPARLTPRVILVQPVIFPVNGRGRLAGHVRAQKRITVDLLADLGPEVVIRLVNSSVRVPRTAVAPTEVLLDESAGPTLADNARSAGQRIIDYWFSGNEKQLVLPPP